MADMFDLNVAGVGWHLTTGLVALVALFVACFAITGYISFRKGSIKGGDIDTTSVLEVAALDVAGILEAEHHHLGGTYKDPAGVTHSVFTCYTDASFGTQANGGNNSFLLTTANATAATDGSNVAFLPAGGTIEKILVEVTTACTSAANTATIDIGGQLTNTGAATANNNYFAALPVTSLAVVGNYSMYNFATQTGTVEGTAPFYLSAGVNTQPLVTGALKVHVYYFH